MVFRVEAVQAFVALGAGRRREHGIARLLRMSRGCLRLLVLGKHQVVLAKG